MRPLTSYRTLRRPLISYRALMPHDNAQSGSDIVRFVQSDDMSSTGKLGRFRMFFVHLLTEFSFFFFFFFCVSVSASGCVCVRLSVRTRESVSESESYDS